MNKGEWVYVAIVLVNNSNEVDSMFSYIIDGLAVLVYETDIFVIWFNLWSELTFFWENSSSE